MILPKIRGKKTGDFTSSFAKGLAAETKAAREYEKLGYKVLARRAKTAAGEIDLILLDPKTRLILFCEVKTRADLTTAAYSIAPAQQQRILRSADTWMGSKPEYAGYRMQFDAFLVDGTGQIRRIENAFSLS